VTLPESTLERLRTQLDALDAILDGVPEEALRRPPPSGKWSALQNLAHLARHHEIFLDRVRRILAEDRPSFPRYRAEDDPEWPRWSDRTPADVRERLAESRRELTLLVEALAPEDLARTAAHAVLGEMPLPLWTEFFLLHEAHHLYVVFSRARER
jgi:DinB family protein